MTTVLHLDDMAPAAGAAKQGTIDINQLPPSLRNRLRVLDVDGDGIIDAGELMQELASHEQSKQTVHLLKRITGVSGAPSGLHAPHARTRIVEPWALVTRAVLGRQCSCCSLCTCVPRRA